MSNPRFTYGYLLNDLVTILLFAEFCPYDSLLHPSTGMTGVTIYRDGVPLDVISVNAYSSGAFAIATLAQPADIETRYGDNTYTFDYVPGNIESPQPVTYAPILGSTGSVITPIAAGLTSPDSSSRITAKSIINYLRAFYPSILLNPTAAYTTFDGCNVVMEGTLPDTASTVIFDTPVGCRKLLCDIDGYLLSCTHIPPTS